MKSPYCNFIVCDVESGGLISKDKKAFDDVALTEIALVAVSKDLEIVDQKSWLIKPYKEGLIYDPRAAEVSGINKQMCEEKGMDVAIVIKEIIAFLKKYKDGSSLPVMLGHNFIKFDGAFMINAFEFCKENLTKYIQEEPEDTLKWGRLVWKESNNYKLGTCCENAQITLQDAHRALTDTVATAKLWIHFMKNLRGEGQKVNGEEVKRFRHTFEL